MAAATQCKLRPKVRRVSWLVSVQPEA